MLREMQLVWRFNRGHTEALREIYEQHKHDLVTLATALLIDKSEAEDVVHDVFVGFIQSGGRFRLTGSLKGFLSTCVANRARNRNKLKWKATAEGAPVDEPAAPDHQRPDAAAMFGEEFRQVGEALAEYRTSNGKPWCCGCVAGCAFTRLPECKACLSTQSRAVTVTAWRD